MGRTGKGLLPKTQIGRKCSRPKCSRIRFNPCHARPCSNFKPVRLLDLDPGCGYKFTNLMTNSADPEQLASSEAI